VLQSFVYGDSLRSQLVAIVVPDPEVLLPWARERGLPQDLPSLCREGAVVAAVHKSMAEEGRAAQLRGFEVVQVRGSTLGGGVGGQTSFRGGGTSRVASGGAAVEGVGGGAGGCPCGGQRGEGSGYQVELCNAFMSRCVACDDLIAGVEIFILHPSIRHPSEHAQCLTQS
jgi:hypothetical protein